MSQTHTTVTDIPDDILRCIGRRLVRTDRPIAATAKDCAAVAMSCKALLHVATAAWTRCALVAECQPDLQSLAELWGCISRTANRERTYKIVRNLPGSNSRIKVSEMDALLRQPGGRVGASCPIAPKAAKFILDVSWLAIHNSTAEKRFWDRDLSRCERMTLSTMRYTSVVAAPVKPAVALAGERASRRVLDLEALDETLRAHNIHREWGESSLMHKLVRLHAWEREVGLTPAMRASVELQLRTGSAFTSELRTKVLGFVELLEEFECQDEPLRSSRCVAECVARALSNGIQKRRLGRVMFAADANLPLYTGRLTRDDVVKLDSCITLVLECNAQADEETLAKFAHVDWIEQYITDVSDENRIKRSVVRTVEVCRARSVHEALEFAAVALIRDGFPLCEVVDDLDAALEIVTGYLAEFSGTVLLGDVGLRAYALDAVCNAVDARAADDLGVLHGTTHFAHRPTSAEGLDAYVDVVRRGVKTVLASDPDVVRLCVARGVTFQCEKIAAWGRVLAGTSYTLEDMRTAFPKLSLEAESYSRAEGAVEAYRWLLDHTDVPVCGLEDHVQTLAHLAAHWKLEKNAGKAFGDLPPSGSRAHFELVKVRHAAFLDENPTFSDYAVDNRFNVPLSDPVDVPETLRPWVVAKAFDLREALSAFQNGRNLDWIAKRTAKSTVHAVVMELTTESDRVWLNRVSPKTTVGGRHDARMRIYLEAHGPASVPPNMKVVFRHLL